MAWGMCIRGSGCGAPEADRFFHFPGCSSLRDLWQEVCPGAAPFFRNLSLAHVTFTTPFLNPEEVVQAMLWSDVVGQCLNDARVGSPPVYASDAAGDEHRVRPN